MSPNAIFMQLSQPTWMMLVPNALKLSIINSQGRRCTFTVEPTANVHYVKRRAIEALYASECGGQEAQAVKKALYYKLIHPASIRTLKDEAKLFDEQITKDCDLLLVKKRLDESRFNRFGAAAAKDKLLTKAPDAARIKEATAKLPKKGSVRKQRELISTDEFQKDLKRILVTLVESAQNILALNPEAAKIFKEAQEIMNQESSTSCVPDVLSVPEESVGRLIDMGFNRERAIRALRRCRMSVHAAMEWLLTNPDDDAAESDTTAPTFTSEAPTHSQDQTTPETAASAPENRQDQPDVRPKQHIASGTSLASKVTNSGSESAPPTSSRKQSRAQTILESFRAYKRRKFKPNVMALHWLLDMGFEEADTLEALRITDNNKEAACEWLLGDRNQSNTTDALEDGIEPSSPLYQSIITNPVVQLGLSNPRCLLAFLHMLENGANTMDWLKDPDVGPVLVQISRIYTAEKSDLIIPGISDG